MQLIFLHFLASARWGDPGGVKLWGEVLAVMVKLTFTF